MNSGLHFQREGKGETLVLLHPVGLDLSCWNGVIQALLGFDTIRLDLPGHGRSPRLPQGAALCDYAAAVKTTLAALGVVRAHILGLSFGGMIAQTFAIDYPEACASLIVAGCPSDIRDEDRPARAERGRLAVREGMAAIADTTIERWFTPAFIASGSAEPTRQRLLEQDVAGWAGAWDAISRLHTGPQLHTVTAPALCIAGELDRATGIEAVALIAQSLPVAEFVVLAGAPHMMQIEQPRAFGLEVSRFLRGVA